MISAMLTSYPIDLDVLAKAWQRFQAQPNEGVFFINEIASRLLERLNYIKLQPQQVLCLETWQAPSLVETLHARYPEAKISSVKSHCQGMPLSEIAASAAESVDLIIANLVPPWVVTHPECLLALRRLLRPNGLLFFTTVGPDSLQELKRLFAQVDAYPRVYEFIDMHHIGDALLAHYWQDPVMDMETLTLRYPDVKSIAQDLRRNAAHFYAQERSRGLLGRHKWQALLQRYETLRDADGLPVTVEVIYGHAWAEADSNAQRVNEQGEVVVPLSTLTKS